MKQAGYVFVQALAAGWLLFCILFLAAGVVAATFQFSIFHVPVFVPLLALALVAGLIKLFTRGKGETAK